MRINRRIVNSKRHTTGFILTGGRRVTRREAVSLARKNQINGVRVMSSGSNAYLMSTTSKNLSDLPEDITYASSSRSRSN